MRRRAFLACVGAILAARAIHARAQGLGFSDIADAASRDNTDAVIAMLEAGTSPDAVDDRGQTPLGYAARFGDTRMANALLYFHAPVDRQDQFGNMPLHWAAQRGSIEIMQLLLDAKAPVDAQNKQGVTPLMLAASEGRLRAVRLLLNYGADPKKEDFTGRDAISWAQGKPNVLQALRAAMKR